ncbi:MAG: class I SAM-dependent methyltransferase [Alcaligenaceae bacterium]
MRSPALRALAVQILALCCVAALALINLYTLALPIELLWLCLLQAGLSTLFSIVLQHEIWWRYIHCIFPIAAYATHRLALPSLIYLVGFLLLLSLYPSCIKNRVPYFPSKKPVWDRINDLLKSRNTTNLIDLGSGLGGLVLDLKQKNPALTVIGIESAPLPWLISVLRKLYTNSKARFILGNYQSLNFGHYDVIFTYLSPAPMENLYAKAVQEMRPNTLFISHEFPVPNVKPGFTLDVPVDDPATYVYVM